MENNFSNGAIRWQISKYVKAVSDFCVNEILTFQILEHGKAGQGF